jgi:hypothetical protein
MVRQVQHDYRSQIPLLETKKGKSKAQDKPSGGKASAAQPESSAADNSANGGDPSSNAGDNGYGGGGDGGDSDDNHESDSDDKKGPKDQGKRSRKSHRKKKSLSFSDESSANESDDKSENDEVDQKSSHTLRDRRELSSPRGATHVTAVTVTQLKSAIENPPIDKVGAISNPDAYHKKLREFALKSVDIARTHINAGGTVQCEVLIPVRTRDYIASQVDKKITSLPSRREMLEKFPMFFSPPTHLSSKENLEDHEWRYMGGQVLFTAYDWDVTDDSDNSPYAILRKVFPALDVTKLESRGDLIRNTFLTYDPQPTKSFPLRSMINTICVNTDTEGTSSIRPSIQEVDLETSQKLVAILYKRFLKATEDTSDTQRQKWAQHILRRVDKTTGLGSTMIPEDLRTLNGKVQTYGPLYWELLCFETAVEQHFTQNVLRPNDSGLANITNDSSESGRPPLKKQKSDSSASTWTHAVPKPQYFDKWDSKRKQKWLQKNSKSKPQSKQQSETASSSTTLPMDREAALQMLTTMLGLTQSAPQARDQSKVKCEGCGRRNHSRETCHFGKCDQTNGTKPHPDFVTKGAFEDSQTFKNLQKVTGPDGKPFRVLQYGKRAMKQGDGTFRLEDTAVGPARTSAPAGLKKVNRRPLQHRGVGRNLFTDITSVYSLLHRRNANGISGMVRDCQATVLLDSGATEFNYVSSDFVSRHKFNAYDLPFKLRVRSVHTTSFVTKYSIIPIKLSMHNNPSIMIEIVIPCLILSESPSDIIVGLPTIQQYRLTKLFDEYFENLSEETRKRIALTFPHLDRHQGTNGTNLTDTPEEGSGSGYGQTLVSSILTNSRYAAYPSATTPILHPGPAPELYKDASSPDNGLNLASSISHLPQYTVQHRDQLLDMTVEPDSDSIPMELDEPPDPLAKEPDKPSEEDEPKIFGSPQLQRRLRALIKKHKHVFATQLPSEPAKISPISFNIDGASWKRDRRTKQYPRPLSRDKEIALDVWIEAALKSGIISEAPAVPNWSQVLLVLKPNGREFRFCVDYTILNTFMESAGWPIPHIGSILRRIAAHRPKYFGTMDSTQGFYQMEVELTSREFLCFTTYLGNYVWNRAPMGPKTVPALFQRAMCVEVFPDLIHKIMEVYIDDFIVWAESEDELITRLDQVFTRASEKNLKLNPRKCRFGMQEVEYCGHVINAEGTTFSKERISEVSDFAIPENHGELKSFLGMAGYMREHIPHYVDVVHPLQTIVSHYSKRKRKEAIVWTPELLEAFQQIKTAISQVYLLHHRDDNAPLRLYTDASSYGIGAYICQVVTRLDGTVQEQPLGFISKSLTDTEKRWSVYEKEAYAIFYACKKWEHFLRGHHFHLFTDHKNLTFLNRPPSEKVMRWRLAIQEFDFSVAYIKGEVNNVADALSRCVPHPDKSDADIGLAKHTTPRPTTLAVLLDDTITPPTLQVPPCWYQLLDQEQRHQYHVPVTEVHTFLGLLQEEPTDTPIVTPQHPNTCSECPAESPMETLSYCLLCPTTVDQHELVQNEQQSLSEAINNLIEQCHNVSVGHGGVDRTLSLLEQLRTQTNDPLFDQWPTQRADVKRFVKTCPVCQKVKQHQLLKYTPHFTVSTYGIFDNISVDTVYMPESESGNKYLLVFIDSFSRYIDLYPIADLSAETAFRCLIQYMSNFGIPSHLCCDNGSQFQGVFQEMVNLLHVNGYKTHPYSHQENSIVERANKEILTVLRCLVLETQLHENWDTLCHVAKRIINSRIHSAIGISPADLVFGGRVDLQRGSLFPYTVPPPIAGDVYMYNLIKQQELMLQKAVQVQAAKDKERLKNNNYSLKTVFPIDSYVLVKPEVDPLNKLTPPWLGPYLITQRFDRREGDVYRCLHLSTNREFDFRVDRLKTFLYNDEDTLHKTAALDKQQYEVEQVLRHRFRGAQTAKNLEIEIKWLGYDELQWQPFGTGSASMSEVGIVHEYLRRNNLAKFVPARFR